MNRPFSLSPSLTRWEREKGRPRRLDRGYTLIEMIVLTSILLLVAGMAAPNLVAIKRSRDIRSQEEQILQLPAEARNDAVKYGAPVTIKFDGNDLLLQREAVPGANTPTATGGQGSVASLQTMTGSTSTPTLTNENDKVASADPTAVQEIRRMTLSSDLQAESAQRVPYTNPSAQVDPSTTTGSTDTGSWQWTVYPDGSQDGGSLTFRIGNGERTLEIPSNGGSPQWVDGPAPAPQDAKWPVGDILRRS